MTDKELRAKIRKIKVAKAMSKSSILPDWFIHPDDVPKLEQLCKDYAMAENAELTRLLEKSVNQSERAVKVANDLSKLAQAIHGVLDDDLRQKLTERLGEYNPSDKAMFDKLNLDDVDTDKIFKVDKRLGE